VFLPQETAYRTSSAVLRAAQTFFAKVALPFPGRKHTHNTLLLADKQRASVSETK
jgi:hypothetical protein